MMRVTLRSTVVIATFLVAFVPHLVTDEPSRAADGPGPYVLTDLGTLGGPSAQAQDINDAGEIIGSSTNAAVQTRAFLWRDGTMSELGTPGSSEAFAVNETGHVVGRSRTAISSTSPYHAVRWLGGSLTDLTPSSSTAYAAGVNEVGQIVGTNNGAKGFVWQNGVLTELGDLGGGCSSASDIDDTGHVVGAACSTEVNPSGSPWRAVIWHNGAVIDLGKLAGMDDSGATAINNLGQIVGSSGRMDPDTYEVFQTAFLYENGVMSPLPVPSGEAYASDINDSGVIVGTMRAGGGPSNYHAYVYANGVATNLNSLVPSGSPLHLMYANAINNAGHIVGTAMDAQGRHHAYLLTPLASGTPILSIGDGMAIEGNDGTRTVNLTVSMSATATEPTTVSFSTANGSATAGDYDPASGVVTFDPGDTSKTISVNVNGDRIGESNETFFVNLSQVQGGALGDWQGTVTISDDEPRLRINSVSKNEGNNGSTQFVFTVSLTPASDADVSVNYATATAWSTQDDFTATSGTLAFAPGQTSKSLTVQVKGDKVREFEETFSVNLSNAVGAFIAVGQGTGTIRNDDR
jgi:probable HAF family extracellular repeat protein